jgi:hypothetical protein
VDKREATALWLLPVAFVVAYRVLAQVTWQLVLLMGDRSTMTPVFGFVLGAACALAIACLCVYGHTRLAGPLTVQRSFLMAAISMPMLVLVHLVTMGFGGLVGYFKLVPVQALLHYAMVFFALPVATAVMGPRGAAPAQDVAPETPKPPASAGLVLLRIAVALVSVLAFIGTGIFLVIAIGFGGFHLSGQDGAFTLAILVALAVFVFSFLCAAGLLRRRLKIARWIVAVVSLPYIGLLLNEGEEFVYGAIVVAAYAGAFWTMCRGMEARA